MDKFDFSLGKKIGKKMGLLRDISIECELFLEKNLREHFHGRTEYILARAMILKKNTPSILLAILHCLEKETNRENAIDFLRTFISDLEKDFLSLFDATENEQKEKSK